MTIKRPRLIKDLGATPVPVLAPGNGKTKYCDHLPLYRQFTGTLQADGYAGYEAVYKGGRLASSSPSFNSKSGREPPVGWFEIAIVQVFPVSYLHEMPTVQQRDVPRQDLWTCLDCGHQVHDATTPKAILAAPTWAISIAYPMSWRFLGGSTGEKPIR